MAGHARPGFLWLATGSLAFAALSVAAPLEPRYDALGWILWGRDLTGPLGFDTTPYPSWKPGAAVITTLLAPAGDLAPALWLLVARAGALMSLGLAWRLGDRLAGPLAGTVAALGLALTERWFVYLSRGVTEGLLVLLVLAAIDRHLDGRRTQALACVTAAALLRPEAWPFLLLYSAWLVRRDPRRIVDTGAALTAVALLWFGGDWLGSGDPLWAGKHARRSAQAFDVAGEAHPWLEVAASFGDRLVLPPLILLSLVAVGFAWRRPRARAVLILAALAVAWVGVVMATASLGYTGLPRFMLPAAALTCVLAGVGLSKLRQEGRWARRLALAVALAAVALAIPRLAELPGQYRAERSIASAQRDLVEVIARLGGRASVRRWRVTTNQPFRPRLAWELDVPAITLVHLVPPTLVFRNRKSRYGAFEKLARVAGRPGRPRLERILVTEWWEVYLAAPG